MQCIILIPNNTAAGGIVRVCGLAMTPRIILMTDGEPSDSEGQVEVYTLCGTCTIMAKVLFGIDIISKGQYFRNSNIPCITLLNYQ